MGCFINQSGVSGQPNLAPHLCGILSVLEKDGTLPDVLARVDAAQTDVPSAEISSWWDAHKAHDRQFAS